MTAPRKIDEFDTDDYTPDELREILEAAQEALKHRDPDPMTLSRFRRETSSLSGVIIPPEATLWVGNPDNPTESPCAVIGVKIKEDRVYLQLGV